MTNEKPAYSSSDVQRGRRMARLLIEHYFGAKPKRLLHKGSGKSNTVFEVQHPEGDFIVRIAPNATGLDAFLKEQWSVARARDAGVPVPEILEVGQGVIPHPYMIQRLLKGEDARNHSQRVEIIRDLGQYARLINSIHTQGFGNTFDWSSNRLSFNNTFREFLDGEFDIEGRLKTLSAHKLLSTKQAKQVRSILDQLAKSRSPSTLAHGDLRLKNAMVDANGKIVAIIDWDNCCASIAPVWDLAIALHDLPIDAKQALVDGYGLAADELDAAKAGIKALNMLHYAPFVARAEEEGDKEMLDGVKMRFGGAFDLYTIE